MDTFQVVCTNLGDHIKIYSVRIACTFIKEYFRVQLNPLSSLLLYNIILKAFCIAFYAEIKVLYR